MRQGVLTGCDGGHAWMMPWWLKHFRKFNPDIEIAFADFGGIETTLQKEIYKQVDVWIDLSEMRMSRNWFKKPVAIRACPFEKVIWMDNDCQVKGNISQMFDWCNQSHVGVTWDVFTGLIRGVDGKTIKRAVQTGIVVTHPKNELIQEWCDMCLKAKAIRGDQEVFNYILDRRRREKNYTTKIKIMPPEFQWLRLQEANNNVLVMHWTGIQGKKEIQRQMGVDPTFMRNY